MKNQNHSTSRQIYIRIQLLIALCLSFATITPASAQHIGGAVMGVKAGIAMIDYKGDAANLTPLISYHTGLYLSIYINERFGFQPELIYSLQRVQGLIKFNSIANYGYVTLPLTAKIYLNKHLNIQIIPQISTLFNGSIRVSENEVFTGKTHFNTTDISLGVGFNAESFSGWNFTMRYFYGFKDTFQPILGYENSPKNILQISFGRTFI